MSLISRSMKQTASIKQKNCPLAKRYSRSGQKMNKRLTLSGKFHCTQPRALSAGSLLEQVAPDIHKISICPVYLFLNPFEGGRFLLYLLPELIKYKDNAVKLAELYYEHRTMLMKLKDRFPNWEKYVNQYLSAEVRAALRERGVPL